MRDSLIKYIKESSEKILKENKDYTMYDRIAFMVKDPLPENINLSNIIKTIEAYVPASFTSVIDAVYIGQFNELDEREVTSLWKDGAIFVDNEQESDDDIIEDLIHEIAHATEDTHMLVIYGDDMMENEFLLKRRHLFDILSAHNMANDIGPFLKLQYSKEFDEYLYETIGYEQLTWLTMGLFVSPYGATSLREYFANGFEQYFSRSGDRSSVKTISPAVYQKIEELLNY